jgi:hypothetical protein
LNGIKYGKGGGFDALGVNEYDKDVRNRTPLAIVDRGIGTVNLTG